MPLHLIYRITEFGEARRGAAWRGPAGRGEAGRGPAWLGGAWLGLAGERGLSGAPPLLYLITEFGGAGRGQARRGEARRGAAGHGQAWHGWAWERGPQGAPPFRLSDYRVRHGGAGPGLARQGKARHGAARLGWSGRGLGEEACGPPPFLYLIIEFGWAGRGKARPGSAGQGSAWRGWAGLVWARRGLARWGTAWRGMAWERGPAGPLHSLSDYRVRQGATWMATVTYDRRCLASGRAAPVGPDRIAAPARIEHPPKPQTTQLARAKHPPFRLVKATLLE